MDGGEGSGSTRGAGQGSAAALVSSTSTSCDRSSKTFFFLALFMVTPLCRLPPIGHKAQSLRLAQRVSWCTTHRTWRSSSAWAMRAGDAPLFLPRAMRPKVPRCAFPTGSQARLGEGGPMCCDPIQS